MRRVRLGWFLALLITVGAFDAPMGQSSERFDLGLPSQENWRDWPTPESLQRLYGLPWSHYAFRRAAFFGQPVLFILTVDWNRASQELATATLRDPELLHAVNQAFITVMVNADLRPDLRERYQTGGWPVIAFLLPDGNPMLSLVNEGADAKPITTSAVDAKSLQFLVREGAVYWSRRREELVTAGGRWSRDEGPEAPSAGPVDASASELLARWMLGSADTLEGGFGAGAKFFFGPLDEYAAVRQSRGLPALRRHSRRTLEILVGSALFDSREGGMHRIATRPGFEGIEYEKLLSVNAGLLRELVASLREGDSPELRRALEKTAGFVTKTLGRPAGGFYLAQGADPDSDDGGEYWRRGGRGDAPPVNQLVLSGPNATAGAALVRAGLFLGREKVVEAGRAALELVRDTAYSRGRGVGHVIEPVLDPRIYLTTQADVAVAFLDAYETTGEASYLDAARDVVDFVRANLKDPKDRLYRDHLPEASPLGLLANERRPLKPNARMARAMIALALQGQGEHYRDEAIDLLGELVGDLSLYGVHALEAALAVEETLASPLRIRIDGPPEAASVRELRRAAVNAPWGRVVLDSGSATGAPAAELSFGERIRSVSDARELHAAVGEIVAGGGS